MDVSYNNYYDWPRYWTFTNIHEFYYCVVCTRNTGITVNKTSKPNLSKWLLLYLTVILRYLNLNNINFPWIPTLKDPAYLQLVLTGSDQLPTTCGNPTSGGNPICLITPRSYGGYLIPLFVVCFSLVASHDYIIFLIVTQMLGRCSTVAHYSTKTTKDRCTIWCCWASCQGFVFHEKKVYSNFVNVSLWRVVYLLQKCSISYSAVNLKPELNYGMFYWLSGQHQADFEIQD